MKTILSLAASLFFAVSSYAATPTPLPLCNGSRFEPCVCWRSVPKSVQYRPSNFTYCKGNAAIVLSGEFYSAFSVVVRDTENSDQSTPGCAAASCSVFKVQKKVRITGRRMVNCLGAKGTSPAFKKIVRITVKVSNATRADGTKDLRRFCLNKPSLALN